MSTLLRSLCCTTHYCKNLSTLQKSRSFNRQQLRLLSTVPKQPPAAAQPSNVEKTKTTQDHHNSEWTTIYRLPLARLAAAYNRLKIHQAILAGVAVPVTYALEQAGHCSANTASMVAALGVTGFITLTVSSLWVQNLIGFIYINTENDKLKLAYVDFWGRRQHTIVNIDDLMPVWEEAKPTRFNLNFYQAVRFHSDEKRTYKLLQRYGVVVEAETFSALFGE